MGYKIFAHSVMLVLGNLRDALRVSGILYLLSGGLGVAVTLSGPGIPAPGVVQAMNPGQIGLLLLVFIVNLVVGMWIAVAWHRYVLIDEMPHTMLPDFSGRRILGYFGNLVLLSLVFMGIGIVGGLVVGVFSAFVPSGFTIAVAIALFLVLLVVFYRLSIVLPAASVEKPLKLREAWAATKGTNGTILAVALLTFIAAFVLQLPALGLLAIHLTFLAQIWGAVVGWFVLMVSVCVATTMYGHYVEGRPIPL